MKNDHIALRIEKAMLAPWFWRGAASTGILVALWRYILRRQMKV
jgi:hypothetical protein